MSQTAVVEHSVSLADAGPLSVAEVAPVHRLVAELPRIAVKVAAFGGGGAGRRPRWLGQACTFDYLGTSDKGVIRFRAPKLGAVAPKAFTGQRELFTDAIDPDETAFSLLRHGLRDVDAGVVESERYDDVLLRRFAWLSGRAFRAGVQRLTLDGDDGGRALVLAPSALDQARRLLERTPPRQRVRLAGRITLLRSRGNAFEVTTAAGGGVARCAFVGASVETIKGLFMTEVAVTGTAVFRPSGALHRIDVDLVHPASDGDRLFERLPVASAPLVPGVPRREARPAQSWLADVVGTWPGPETETEAELLEALRESR